jgi:RNA 3'-terminal phosphate cyclase-like protein
VELEVRKRGCSPGGGGEVLLRVPPCRKLRAVEVVEEGLVRRVRGVAYACKVSPQMANRMAGEARGVLNNLLPDVFVVTDVAKGASSGASAGYGIILLAETTSGVLYCAEAAAKPPAPGGGAGDMTSPEELGTQCAHQLLEEISRGGCVDSSRQALGLTLCAMSSEGASRLRLGPLTEQAVAVLRILKDVLGVTFRLDAERATGTVMAACVGAGGIGNASVRYA